MANSPVLILPGVTTSNPFLPRANGIDLSQPMGTVKIDFSDDESAPDSSWNTVTVESDYANGISAAIESTRLKNTSGSMSRAVISSDDVFFSNSTATADAENAGLDYIFIKEEYATKGNIFIDGLDPTKKYDISMLARRDSSYGRIADYYINDSLMQTVNADNNSTITSWTDVYPDENGTIKFTIDKTNYSDPSNFGYVNWLIVTEN